MGYLRWSLLVIIGMVAGSVSQDTWERQDNWVDGPPNDTPRVTRLEVVCGKNHMTVQMDFDKPFNGIVFSKGKHSDHQCVYVRANSNRKNYIFDVFYDACGTKPDLHGNFYENTVVIQYGNDIIEAWDEAKRLRCEWHEAYEKAAAQPPPIRLADLDVVELNFQGDNIDCWMEIQEGKGPWSREVTGLVPLGSPLTMVVAINDQEGQFDMRVKSCFAHDGHKAPIQLTDEWGCVMRPKMLSQFIKVRDYNGRASVVSYSHFFAFKFPDTMDVHIQCKVEVCRHGCPDSCQKSEYKPLDLSEAKKTAAQTAAPTDQLDRNELNAGYESKVVTVKAGSHRYRPPPQQHHQHHQHHHHQLPQSSYLPSPQPSLSHPTHNEAVDHHHEDYGTRLKENVKYVASEIKNNQGGLSGIKLTAAKVEEDIRDELAHHDELPEEPVPKPEPSPEEKEREESRHHHPEDDHHKAESVKSYQVYNEHNSDSGVKHGHSEHLKQAEAHINHDHGDTHFGQFGPPPTRPADNVGAFVPPAPEPEPSFKPVVNPPGGLHQHNDFHQSGVGGASSPSVNHNVYVPGKNPRLEDDGQQPRGPVPATSHVNLFHNNQVDKSFGRQRFIPPVLYKPPKPHYPYPIPQFVPPQPLFINMAERADSKGHRPQYHSGPPQLELRSYQSPSGVPGPSPEFVMFPQGPRSIRLRRSAADGREIGVQQVYRAVASIDLAFEPNATRDMDQVYAGRREEIVYGVCLPVTGFAVGLGFLLIITLGSLVVCGYLVFQWRFQMLNKSGKNTLSNLTAKIKNGRMELFYQRGAVAHKT